MAVRLTCAQGHLWQGGAGGSSACPVCGAPAAFHSALRTPHAAIPEGLLPAVLDSLADGLVAADADGHFLLFNAAAERLLGFGPLDAPCADWPRLYGVYQADGVTLLNADDMPLVRAMRGQPTDQLELVVRNQRVPKGVTLSVTGRPLRDPDGSLRGGVVLFRDITDLKLSMGALAHSEARFRNLFDNSPDAVFVEAFDGTVLDVNRAACRLHGRSRDELIGVNVLDLVPPGYKEEVADGFARLVTGESHHVEGFSWTRDGQPVPVELQVSHIDHGGQPALLIHVRELTERKRAEDSTSAN
jgi:PAS domain S-box-containing protein